MSAKKQYLERLQRRWQIHRDSVHQWKEEYQQCVYKALGPKEQVTEEKIEAATREHMRLRVEVPLQKLLR